MKKICILFCGGTITMKRNKYNVLTPFYNAKDLLNFVPQLNQLAEISVIQIANIDSTNIEPGFWTILAETIKKNVDKYDGFVVAHGTDTMAYTASAISFALHNIDKPIVFTGSQKPVTDVASDASNNLINAVLVSLKIRTGIVIVFGTKILQGNRATKINESNLDAFDSPMVIPMGMIKLEPEIYSTDIINKQKNVPFNINFDSNIIIVKITPGLSNNNLEKIISSNYHGIILEGFGAGGIPDSLMPFLNKAKDEQLPVVILSQCKNGMTKMHLYEVGRQAVVGGGIPGGDMTIEAASTKLMWILAQTRDIRKIRQLFLTNIVGEVTITAK